MASTVVVGISVFLSSGRGPDTSSGLRWFRDPGLAEPIENIEGLWNTVDFGWNNRTLWCSNAGNSSFYLLLQAALPPDWRFMWNYDNSSISPMEKLPVTFSLYVPFDTQFQELFVKIRISVVYRIEDGDDWSV